MLQPVRCAGGPPSSSSQQLVELMALGSPGDDALQHVGQVGLRIDSWSFAVFTIGARIAQLSAPSSLPLNNELRLPMAIGRMERSTVLLSGLDAAVAKKQRQPSQ